MSSLNELGDLRVIEINDIPLFPGAWEALRETFPSIPTWEEMLPIRDAMTQGDLATFGKLKAAFMNSSEFNAGISFGLVEFESDGSIRDATMLIETYTSGRVIRIHARRGRYFDLSFGKKGSLHAARKFLPLLIQPVRGAYNGRVNIKFTYDAVVGKPQEFSEMVELRQMWEAEKFPSPTATLIREWLQATEDVVSIEIE